MMQRIVVPETLFHQWVHMQTFFRSGKVVKEFYKFDGETPTDRIFVSYNKELPISDEIIMKCLDEVVARWLECCFIDNNGQTNTIISSYKYMATKDGMEMSVVFGNQYYVN